MRNELSSTQPDMQTAPGNSLVVQLLGLLAFTAEGPGSVPSQGN